MKSAEELLSTYKSVHLNRTNLKTHFVGIPLILWSIMLLLHLIELPYTIYGTQPLTAAYVSFPLVLVYYFALNVSLAVGMTIVFIPLLYSSALMAVHPQAAWIAVAVFFIGWVFQFIGHYYEKAKPAFFDDIKQLLIGPFFLMAEIYFMLGLSKSLEQTITPMAVEKRRSLGEAAG